jgi:hypothetical protein
VEVRLPAGQAGAGGIGLEFTNPAYNPIVLDGADDLRVIAVFIAALPNDATEFSRRLSRRWR